MAARPKTLAASIAPVIIGTAMACADGLQHWPSAIAALFGALFIQIGTNFSNDYFDFKKGADRSDRIGPTRVTQAGLVSPRAMRLAIIFSFAVAVYVSVYLIGRGGLPIAIIGVISILCGLLYTAGPLPLGYLGLGELFVLVFFGPVAVGGTYYVQTLEITPLILISGLAPGLLSVAILTVNNLRDIEEDQKSDKRTLAVRFGRNFAIGEYFFSITAASFIPVALYLITQDYPFSLSAASILFLAYPAFRTVFTKTDGPSLNNTLAYTGKLLLWYSIIFSFGWLR